jgi:hypothetical protein
MCTKEWSGVASSFFARGGAILLCFSNVHRTISLATRNDAKTQLALLALPLEGQFDSVCTPPGQQKANMRQALPALIEGAILLPGLALLRSKSYLEQLYVGRHLSAREIASVTGVSRSMVLEALDRFGIPQNGNGHRRPGHIPFGFDYLSYRLVKNKAEQGVIRLIRQYRVGGQSLRQIASQLNQHLVPTKNSGIWQANTVRLILART